MPRTFSFDVNNASEQKIIDAFQTIWPQNGPWTKDMVQDYLKDHIKNIVKSANRMIKLKVEDATVVDL